MQTGSMLQYFFGFHSAKSSASPTRLPDFPAPFFLTFANGARMLSDGLSLLFFAFSRPAHAINRGKASKVR